MRAMLAVLMAVHGIAHLPGFIQAWSLAPLRDLPYRTTVLGGRFDLGDTGIRVVGLFWLLAAAGFLVCAGSAATGRSWWVAATKTSVLASLVLCALGWPEARIGMVVNLAILVAVTVISRLILA